jgi:hypothetical protein
VLGTNDNYDGGNTTPHPPLHRDHRNTRDSIDLGVAQQPWQLAPMDEVINVQ